MKLMKMRNFALMLAAVATSSCVSAPRDTHPGVLAILKSSTTLRTPAADAYSSFLVARYASLTNDPDVAARGYAFASRATPGDSGLVERAVFSALLSGDMPAAVRAAAGASADTRANASLARLVLGVNALSRGEAALSHSLLGDSDFGSFNRIVARGVAAWAALELEGLEAAEDILVEVRSGDALMDGLTIYTSGLLQLAAGEDAAALATFEAGWRDGVRLAVATEAYARLLAASGRQDEAIERLEDFRAAVGPNPAVDALRRALIDGETVEIRRPSVSEGAALAIYTPAAALAAQTDGDLAGVYFALALALDPNLDAARTLWGDALDSAGRRADAVDVLDAVPETSPFYASARGQLAWVLRREERNDEAVATAAEALAAHPDRDLKIQLGDLYRSLQRDEDAVRVFTEIIHADESAGRQDWRLLYARGAARHRLGRWPAAQADLQAALALQPDDADLLNYLGYAWVDRGQNVEAAFRMIQRASELRPDAGHIVDSLGWAYYRLGRYDEAVSHLERATELAPGNAEINDHLGDAYWRVGRRLEAGYQWRRALSLGADPVRAAQIEDKLAHGLSSGSLRTVAQDDGAANAP